MQDKIKENQEKEREKISRLWSNVRLLNTLSFIAVSGFLIASIININLLTIQSAFFFYCFTVFMFCSSLTSSEALYLSKVETLRGDIHEIEKKHLDYRINVRNDEIKFNQEFRITRRARTFQQVVVYIEAPDTIPVLDMVSTLEKLSNTLRNLNCAESNSLNGFYMWDFVPTDIRMSVTSAEVKEVSGFFPIHCGTEVDEDAFKQALWNVENNSKYNSISVLLQEVSDVPAFYFGLSINQICEEIRNGEIKGAKYDNESGHSFILHLSENQSYP